MRKIILFCVVVSTALPSVGQGQDTAFAVHKLFQQKRLRGAESAATGASVAVQESIGWRSIRSPADIAAAAVHGGVPLVAGVLQARRFSTEREQVVLQCYADGWSIPAHIRRKLRRKHFHRTSRDVAPLVRQLLWQW
ncbi:MAG TPA: hypothetical protein VK364_02180 [Hymenobacter sp.]|nr:hypothetical protein [Hymenobacter sp.]